MAPFDWDTPIAKPMAVVIAAALVVLGVGSSCAYHYRAKASQAENAANVAKGEADAAKAQAQAKDAEIAAKDSGLEQARADVARKIAELARLRASLRPSAPEDPVIDEPIQPGVVDLIHLVAKQDEVIHVQANFIKGLEVKISDLTISRDAWKQSSDARERESAGLRIALEAQKSLTKSALWKGRFQGLAVGIATGYAVRGR